VLSARTISIRVAEGDSVRYTTDGTDPATSKTAVSKAAPVKISLTATTTNIRALAVAKGVQSTESSATYTLNPALSRIVGPVTPMGSSPWPWYDKAELGNAKDIPAAALSHKPTLGPQAAGTFQLVDGCTITLTGPGASEFNAGDMAIVEWNTADGPGTGRLPFLIQSRNGNVLTSANQCGLGLVTAGSQLAVYHCGVGCMLPASDGTYRCDFWGMCNFQNGSWNFYDAGLALYRVYMRTADAADLHNFRDLTDTWWAWALDHGGTQINPPRGASLVSQFARALDGHPERLALLFNMIQSGFNFQILTEIDGEDNREPGYSLINVAVGAAADPDPKRHAWYCSVLSSHAQDWLTAMQPQGYWAEKNGSYAYTPTGFGPWRLFAPLQGLARSYDVLVDTSAQGCNNTGLASHVLTAVEKAAKYVYLAGFDRRSRGYYYDLDYAVDGQDGTNAGYKPGTVSVALGSTQVTGVGTKFKSTFACDGKDFIGIWDTSTYNTWAYEVKSCADDQHLTLAAAYGSQRVIGEKAPYPSSPATAGSQSVITAIANASDTAYFQAPAAFTDCGTAASYCWPASGERSNNLLVPWIFGWLYSRTGDPTYRDYGDQIFSATYGGPADGPGTTGRCGGPDCDGQESIYDSGIHNCAVNPTLPCVSGANNTSPVSGPGNAYMPTVLSKWWGQGSGIGGADNYLAWRVKADQPDK